MPTPNISEIVTTTLQSRTKKLADNVLNNVAILYRLKQKDKVKPFSGGNVIFQELMYADNSTFQWYSGYQQLNVSPSDVLTSAEFDIKQAAVAVSISGLEMLQNAGPEAVIDLLEGRIQVAEKTMMNNLASGMYSNGTGSGGKEIGGLQLLVADTPTNTVGGISRTQFPFWANKTFDASTDGGTAATAANIQSYMNRLAVQLVRNTDRPDLILSDNNYYSLYLSSLQAIQRITDEKMAGAGFSSLKYFGAGNAADVVLDGGEGGSCPTNHMYFLNTDYIHYRPHRDRNMVPLDPDRFSTNQDAMVKLIGWAGNMTLSNGSLQGVLKA